MLYKVNVKRKKKKKISKKEINIGKIFYNL